MLEDKTQKIRELLTLYQNDIQSLHNDIESTYRHSDNIQVATRTVDPRPVDASDIVVLQDVVKQYMLSGEIVHALRGITFSIKKGEFIAITGASGSGKSTLLQIIGCLDTPSSGSLRIEGREISKLSDSALSELRQRAIGFIFQSFYLQPFLTLKDNLAVPAMFTHESKKTINTKVEKLLERVGLSERADHYPKELSGGQIQRAAIARALINNPRIILADEPTGNLDSTNSQSIIELFKTIRYSLGTTIIVVTHDLDIARQADRIIELKDGEIV
jgi:ABC-type lipoprotein export system ATPase subunit